MNTLTTNITTLMKPKAALVVYHTEGAYADKYHVEVRSIGEDDRMGAGKPVTMEFLTALAGSFSESYSNTPHGKIPENLLYCNPKKGFEKYVWYNMPCTRVMYFKDSLKIDSGEYCIPGVVYVLNKNELYVYSFKGSTLFDDTKLFRAPFFNVYTNGNVCQGYPKIDYPQNPSFSDFTEYWEKRFWLTEFSHLNGGNPTKKNLITVTKSSKESFDESMLVSAKMKLKDLLK